MKSEWWMEISAPFIFWCLKSSVIWVVIKEIVTSGNSMYKFLDLGVYGKE